MVLFLYLSIVDISNLSISPICPWCHFSISLFSSLDLIMCKQYMNICDACSALHDPARQEANIIGNPIDAKKSLTDIN
jgi:hypothetical protein